MLGCGIGGVQRGTLAFKVQKKIGLVDEEDDIPEIVPEERVFLGKSGSLCFKRI